MNSEDAKTRSEVRQWLKAFSATLGIAIAVPVFLFAGSVVWFFFIRTPGVILEAREIAAAVRSQVSESQLTAYLATCEQDILRGAVRPTNCVPPWLAAIQTSHAKFGTGARMAGTNLTVTAIWADGRGFTKMSISNDPEAHPERGRGKGNYTVMAWTNCSITVATEGQ
jgi:hypothetical protein